ncbi:DENN domain-containing protein 3 isoform X9 [Homo sapiens]|uniref:DENN domain-containing protein 3 isoform X9 n=1 Tax=Homo sapiens TaxID=9606 RepID=UPI0023DFDBCD|nr:DENN domain-containing protein 3 isoform X9 [Homo sapiens]
MAEAASPHLSLPSGLLELCALLGAPRDSLRSLEQVAYKKGVKHLSALLDPEVLSIFVPPFISKEDSQTAGANCGTLGKTRMRSLRKKREKPRPEQWKGLPGPPRAPEPEDVAVPGGVDLLTLPQLCFPGGVCVATEPKEDCVHFLVLTDVCGNRTYGVVAQYYRPLHVFNMKSLQIVLPARADPESPILDLDLHLPLLCFRPEKVLQILTCILTEQRIVFFSSDWALLTLVTECFMAYLYPLQWQHPFVPILSDQMLDFVMAPTSFLMGCHLDHFEEVSKEADGLVLINIDHGSITYSKSTDDNVDIPDVPLLAAQTFIQRDVKNHLNYEHRVFNSEEFLKTRAPGDHQFYKQVLDTYMFHSFLKARLNRRMDAFAQMDLDTQSEEDRINGMLLSPRRPTVEKRASRKSSHLHVTHRRMVVSMPNLQDIAMPELAPRNSSLRLTDTAGCRGSSAVLNVTPKSPYTFKIPEIHFPLESKCVQAYHAHFVSMLSEAMCFLAPDNSLLLARYLYLRGLVYLMQGQLLNALLDFQNLYKTDIRIFPTDLVKRTVESMSAPEWEGAEQAPELMRLISEILDKPHEASKLDDHVKKFKLPKKHMQLGDFMKRVQESGIVKDASIIHRLFEALTVGQEKQIDPETFKDFYNCWKETEAEAQEVSLPWLVMEHLDKNECVCKLSSSVKTNLGVGKIAMTQKRLFLLTEGRPGYLEISTFRNIEEVRRTTTTFLLRRIPTLKIRVASKKEVFEANLKTECDLWHLMVKEMWAGKKLADDHKDPHYVQQALTNVLLMDAVVGTLQSPGAIYAASKLSYFDKMSNEMPMTLPETTLETLKHKINPSAGEAFPQAVDVLLYTPGHLDPAEKVEDAHPKLWCALSEGKVTVFNASSWTIHQHSFKVGTAKVNCMVMADQNQVWVGSEDSVIYIINVHSMSCNKQLTAHCSSVTDLIVQDGQEAPSNVYSCSMDGMVLVWNVSTLQVTSRFQLPRGGLTSIRLHGGRLWCCTGNSIMVMKMNGSLHQELKIEENFKDTSTSFLAFQLLPEEEQLWAACAGRSEVYIWSLKDLAQPPQRVPLEDCSEINCMIRVKKQVGWRARHPQHPRQVSLALAASPCSREPAARPRALLPSPLRAPLLTGTCRVGANGPTGHHVLVSWCGPSTPQRIPPNWMASNDRT